MQWEATTVLAGKSPTLADLAHLSYTRMGMHEVLRLYPPAWVIARTALTNDVIGGYPIPAQATLLLSPYVTHRHPAFWPAPEHFNPERFAPSQRGARPACAYVPFSAGQRGCLGEHLALLETQLIAAQVLQAYQLSLCAGHKSITPQPLLTLTTVSGGASGAHDAAGQGSAPAALSGDTL